MRIGELSRRTGVNERLLRYYEEQGLLRPDRLPSGYRVYAESDVQTVGRDEIYRHSTGMIECTFIGMSARPPRPRLAYGT
jgi:DNA-binding transcriptional MerR regulator